MKNVTRLVLFLLTACCVSAINLFQKTAPEVVIEQGTLSGILSNDGDILKYIGIPYGTVNSSNKFQAPFPAPKWEGTFKATRESSCFQNLGITFGEEDCLKINVYVPALAKKPVPVMVFIHGGGLKFGSGGKLIYGPEFLVKHDVILVTLNYRLGILGFLCLGIKEAPGNAGLKDQIAALRWVQKNIAAFGGDPDNVTVFGESGGAASTAQLLASEATKGLFKGAIIESGSSLAGWSFNRNPIQVASTVAKTLGYDTEDPHKLYEILSKITPKKLTDIKATKDLGNYTDSDILHLPCIENPIPGIEPALSDLPYNLLRNNPKNIPVIYGSNSKEAWLFTKTVNATTLKEYNKKYLFASDLGFPSEAEAAEVNKKIKKNYFGEEDISSKTINNLTDLITQLYFEVPPMLETQILNAKNEAPVFNYYFDYSGGRNLVKILLGYGKESGACHTDELFYLFNTQIDPFPINKEDQKMIDWMTKMWTNFAKYGDPTPPTETNLPVKWLPSSEEELRFLYIQNELKMGPVPHPEAYTLWRDIYTKYRKTYVNSFN